MDTGMLEILERISQSTTYLAIGGTLALLFLLVFAQSIFGARTTHSQLKALIGQTERMNEKLEDIARNLGKDPEKPQSTKQSDSAKADSGEG